MQPERQRKHRIFFFAVAAVAALSPSSANAACTWKFDWYCADCAKIDGRTTGEQGGYPSESACESARGTVRSPVTTTMSCDRVGSCDALPTPQRPQQPRDDDPGGGIAVPQPDYGARGRQDAEIRRQEEARLAAERERTERERQAFERAKADVLGALKGSTLDQGDGVKETGGSDTLQLKSGTATFGIKGNPGGGLRLKDPAAVRLKDPTTASIDPAFFTRPKSQLRIRHVPNPVEAAKGTWLRYVRSDRAGLILDALEAGGGDLDRAIVYLDGQIIRHGTHVKASAAISYLEGLKTSYIAAGAEYARRVNRAGESATVKAKALLAAVGDSDARRWPGSANPNPGAKPRNIHDWRNQRTAKLLAALKATPGDLEKTYAALQTDKDPVTADNAEHYLRGVFAYWDYLDLQGTKK